MNAWFRIMRLYWPLTLILAGWVFGLTACGAAAGWTLAKTACGLEP